MYVTLWYVHPILCHDELYCREILLSVPCALLLRDRALSPGRQSPWAWTQPFSPPRMSGPGSSALCTRTTNSTWYTLAGMSHTLPGSIHEQSPTFTDVPGWTQTQWLTVTLMPVYVVKSVFHRTLWLPHTESSVPSSWPHVSMDSITNNHNVSIPIQTIPRTDWVSPNHKAPD